MGLTQHTVRGGYARFRNACAEFPSVRHRTVSDIILENGAPDWIRTSGLRLRRATLYPAELRVLCAYAMLTRKELQCEPNPAQSLKRLKL